MSPFSFSSPVQAFFGFDSILQLDTLLEPYTNICLVSGRNSLEASGFRKHIESRFAKKSIFYFNQVEENPSIETILKGAMFARENRSQIVIGLGGGSPLDASKAIAYFAANDGAFYDHLNRTDSNPPLPVIAIPTTCGTGSEMNQYSIITDRLKQDKVNFSKPNTFPKFALLDPFLLRSLPEKLLFATVFDAFTHCMEGFLSLRANAFSDIQALHGMELILSTLEKGKKKDDATLAQYLFASALGGLTILHTGTTLLHALGYYLTNEKGIHHGTANSILLPAFLEMLRIKNVEKYRVVSSIMEKYSLLPQLNLWIEQMGQSPELKAILTADEVESMVDYALTKKNAESTPFAVEKGFVLEQLLKH